MKLIIKIIHGKCTLGKFKINCLHIQVDLLHPNTNTNVSQHTIAVNHQILNETKNKCKVKWLTSEMCWNSYSLSLSLSLIHVTFKKAKSDKKIQANVYSSTFVMWNTIDIWQQNFNKLNFSPLSPSLSDLSTIGDQWTIKHNHQLTVYKFVCVYVCVSLCMRLPFSAVKLHKSFLLQLHLVTWNDLEYFKCIYR